MASSQDKFRKTAGVPSTTLSSAISATDDVISFANTTDWPTDTGIDIVVDRIDQNGNLTPEKKEVMTIVVNENTGVQAIRGINGNACAHDAGAIVEPSVVSAKGHNDMIDGILNIHKQDGTLKDKVVKAQNIDFNTIQPTSHDLTLNTNLTNSGSTAIIDRVGTFGILRLATNVKSLNSGLSHLIATSDIKPRKYYELTYKLGNTDILVSFGPDGRVTVFPYNAATTNNSWIRASIPFFIAE